MNKSNQVENLSDDRFGLIASGSQSTQIWLPGSYIIRHGLTSSVRVVIRRCDVHKNNIKTTPPSDDDSDRDGSTFVERCQVCETQPVSDSRRTKNSVNNHRHY